MCFHMRCSLSPAYKPCYTLVLAHKPCSWPCHRLDTRAHSKQHSLQARTLDACLLPILTAGTPTWCSMRWTRSCTGPKPVTSLSATKDYAAAFAQHFLSYIAAGDLELCVTWGLKSSLSSSWTLFLTFSPLSFALWHMAAASWLAWSALGSWMPGGDVMHALMGCSNACACASWTHCLSSS